MATTGAVKGNLLGVYVDVSGTDTLIACTTGGSFSASLETIDATCKDNDGARAILPGGQTWSMSVDGLIKYDAAYGMEDLWTLFAAKTQVTVRWSTEVAGDTYKEGSAYITSFEETAGLNEVSTYSVSFEGTGTITSGTVV